MKNFRLILISFLALGLFLSSCKKHRNNDIVPDNVNVKLSDAISVPDLDKKELVLQDTVSGRDLYQELRTLIYVGGFASDLIQSVLQSIKLYEIDKPMQFTYSSFEDGQTKDLEVSSNVTFEKELWDYQLVITNEQKQRGFELFWNMNPKKVIAILKPGAYNTKALIMRNAMIRLDYSEINQIYDRTLMVRIAQMDSITLNFMKSMKMFLGQKGDVIDFYGNTIHPWAYIMDPDHIGGRSWSFKGRNNTKLNIAIAKCALPPVNLTNAGMSTLWTTYAMDSVLETEISAVYVGATPTEMEPYLVNARGPAYFIGPSGFVSSGSTPPPDQGFTSTFINITGFDPFPPEDVYMMTIGW